VARGKIWNARQSGGGVEKVGALSGSDALGFVGMLANSENLKRREGKKIQSS